MHTCTKCEKAAKLVFNKFRDRIYLLNERQHITQSEVTKLFEEFGDQIRVVKVKWTAFNTIKENWEVHKVVSNLIEQKSSESLREFSAYQFLKNEEDISKMLISITHITKLELVSCISTLDVLDILNNCQLLEELVLNSYGHWNEPPPVRLSCPIQNVNMRKLIMRYNFPLQVIKLLEQIDIIAPNLQELEINEVVEETFGLSILNIAKLKQLTVLSVNFNGENAVPLLQRIYEEQVQIEKLTLIDTKVNIDFTSSLKRLQTITCLTLSEIHGLNISDIYRMLANSLISELTLHRLQIECVSTFFKLCKGKLPQLKILKLEMLINPEVSGENCDFINDRLKLANLQMLVKITDSYFATLKGNRTIERTNLKVQLKKDYKPKLMKVRYEIQN